MTTALAVLTLVVGVPLNLIVTIRLWSLYTDDRANLVIRERAIAATIVLLLVIVFGLIFVNNDLIPPPISFVDTKLFTRLAMLTVAIVPASYWLLIY